MSRHVIPNAPGSPATRTTTVGWDAPLNTFFAMAFDRVPDSGDDEYEDEIEVFWDGMMPGEIPTVEALEQVLSEYGVTLPSWAAAELAADTGDHAAALREIAAYAQQAGVLDDLEPAGSPS